MTAATDDIMATFREKLIGRSALVLEDEDTMRDHMVRMLRDIGFSHIDEATTGEEAVARADRHRYDVLILDRMTASMDGVTALRAIRQSATNAATPAIFLSALGSERHRLEGLAEGDDYLVKPVSDEELFARLAVLLRRAERPRSQPDDAPLTVGILSIDRQRLSATLGGMPIDLTPREFSVLAVLAENAGLPVTRSMLWSRCWQSFTFEPTNFVNTIDVQISRLRRKLVAVGDACGVDASAMIVAVRVQGIMLCPPRP